jgi:hypothetical protein
MASKRIGIFSALGGFAKGASQGISTAADLQKMVAENELKKMMLQRELQKDSEEKAYKAAKEAGDATNEKNNLRMNALSKMQPSSYTDAATGKTITIPGVPRETMDLQFPGLLEPPKPADSTTPPIPDLPLGSKAKFGDSSKQESFWAGENRRTIAELKKDFEEQSKPFQVAQSAAVAARTHAALDSAVGDTQLVYDLIQQAQGKAQVSDADVAAFARQGGIDNRVYQAFLNAENGTRFSPEIKQQIIDSINSGMANHEQLHKQREEEFRRQAVGRGVDPKLVVYEMRQPKAELTSEQAAQLSAKPNLTPDELASLGRWLDKHQQGKQ